MRDEVDIISIADTSIAITKSDKSFLSKGTYILKSDSRDSFMLSINENGKIHGQFLIYSNYDSSYQIWTISNGLFKEKKHFTKWKILKEHIIYSQKNRDIITYKYDKGVLYAKGIVDRRIAYKLKAYDFSSIKNDNYYSLTSYFSSGKIQQTSVLKNGIITTIDYSVNGKITNTKKQYAEPGLPLVKPLKYRVETKTIKTKEN